MSLIKTKERDLRRSLDFALDNNIISEIQAHAVWVARDWKALGKLYDKVAGQIYEARNAKIDLKQEWLIRNGWENF